jgi:glutamate---cysteine ligase / carboxylate-amine ligase
VASGTAPFRTPGLAALTDQPRYRELARRYGSITADSGTCGCHVHVGVPSPDLGVQVLARLRPWLAPLLAVTANSPIADGRDTGWASWRYQLQARWPTVRAPTVWPDAAAYDTAVRRLIARGAALDERSVYFLARLSPRYPTVEVRVADVCLDVDTAVLVAGLTRALVATALAEARQGAPVAAAPARRVAAALDAAARHGLAGTGVDPITGRAVDARTLHRCLLEHVYPALSDSGDTQIITELLHRLDDRGTGADRQRALFTSTASTPAFIQALARATLRGRDPRGSQADAASASRSGAPSCGITPLTGAARRCALAGFPLVAEDEAAAFDPRRRERGSLGVPPRREARPSWHLPCLQSCPRTEPSRPGSRRLPPRG